MKNLFKLTSLLGTLFLFNSANASIYNFVYEATSSVAVNTVSGDFGVVMNIGDTANFDVKTQNGFSFSGTASNFIWGIVGISESGTRNSDYNFAFLNNGSIVHSGFTSQNTMFAHIGPYINLGFDGIFDEFRWSGILNSSSTASNTTFNFNHFETNAAFIQDPVVNNVPEPATLALLGMGLAAIGFRRQDV